MVAVFLVSDSPRVGAVHTLLVVSGLIDLCFPCIHRGNLQFGAGLNSGPGGGGGVCPGVAESNMGRVTG